jgi:predicted permease
MAFGSRLRGLFGRRVENEVEAELRSHIEMRIDMNMKAGMSPDEARRDAVRRFGNPTWMKEETRRADILPWLETISQDVRYALRLFRKSPTFTAVALITLTLGIGANTAVFTLTHAMLLRSLPVQRPDELVTIKFSKPDQDFGLSGPMFDEIKRRQQVFSGVLGWSGNLVELKDGDETRQVYAAVASGDAFHILGIRPALGRAITPEDDRPGGGGSGWVCMLGYNYWASRFHSDPGVLGRTLTIEGTAVSIVGVLPRGFDGVQIGAQPVAVMPLEFEPVLHPKFAYRHQAGALWLTVMGRLKPGATLAQAREEVQRIGPAIQRDTDPKGILSKGFFGGSKWGAESGRTGRLFLRSTYREPLLFLQGLVGLILLICSANVAGLMLARASARRHELAVRAALGASRARMIRQLAIEGGLLAAAGAVAGLAMAKLSSELLVRTLAGVNPVTLDLTPDRGVLLFTTAIATLATVVSALPSAVRATRVQPVEDLKSARTTAAASTWAEASLVAAQVGLSAVLLVAAGLLAGTLYRLLSMDPGYRTAGVVIIRTDFSKVGKSGEERLARYEELLHRVGALPGVQSASAEEIPMLSGWVSNTNMKSTLPDGSTRADDQLFYNRVGPNYFGAAGTRLLQGRDVQFSDRLHAPDVCWLNQSAAAFFFPAGNPVGQFLMDSDSKASERCEVVGVVQDAKYTSLREAPRRILYTPFLQQPNETAMRLIVRSDNLEAAAAEVRRVLREMAPAAPLLDPITIRDQVHQSIGREQAVAMLALFFGAVGLLLAGVGVYGLVSYQVVQRTREIGVRIALGATRSDVVALLARRVALLACAGLAVGMAASVAVARLLGGLLFQIKPYDPGIYFAAGLLLLSSAFVASFLPARRATRVDPMVALRYE